MPGAATSCVAQLLLHAVLQHLLLRCIVQCIYACLCGCGHPCRLAWTERFGAARRGARLCFTSRAQPHACRAQACGGSYVACCTGETTPVVCLFVCLLPLLLQVSRCAAAAWRASGVDPEGAAFLPFRMQRRQRSFESFARAGSACCVEAANAVCAMSPDGVVAVCFPEPDGCCAECSFAFR